MSTDPSERLRVWDPVVRIGHWVLVAAFSVAYLSEGEPLDVHSWAGYAIAAVVVLRVLWGFVGPRRARFSDFVRGPRAVLGYLRGLATGSAPRYIGHSPAGGAMAVALLLSLAATAVTGMATLAVEEGQGPLAPLFAQPEAESSQRYASWSIISAAHADDDDEGREGRDGREGRGHGDDEAAIGEVHEFFANLTLLLVVLHLAGVAVASLAHRENLVAAMFSGRKRA